MLKLGIAVAKRAIQKYLHAKPERWHTGQTWSTFLKAHAADIWACDFVPVVDLLFRQVHVFFIIALQSRQVIHFGVTREPSQFWVAQQLREATAEGKHLRFIIRDNDSKFGHMFDALAAASGIKVLRTPIKAPRANGVCERFIGSVRRVCLDHMLICGERQLNRVIRSYVAHVNCSRPHQGIGQRVPCSLPPLTNAYGKIVSVPVLNGLHHEYRRAA